VLWVKIRFVYRQNVSIYAAGVIWEVRAKHLDEVVGNPVRHASTNVGQRDCKTVQLKPFSV